MKKRFLALFLTLALTLALLPAGAFASSPTSGTCGNNVTWSFNQSTGTLTISGTGPMEDYKYGAAPWYGLKEEIKTVMIENGVTCIGEYAFQGCFSLTSVTIPNSVTSIGKEAFLSCSSLTNVTIPNSVTSIGGWAFTDCDSLTSVMIPSSVTSIGMYTFTDCDSLTSVTLSTGVISIENYAFSTCNSLTSVIIPDSVISVGEGAFQDCTNLTDVYYGGSEAQWTKIQILDRNNKLLNATIHYNSTMPGSAEYDYDVPDPGADVELPSDGLVGVTNPDSAAGAVRDLVGGMTGEQKGSATGADLAELYAEAAIAKAASKTVSGSEVVISASSVADIEAEAKAANTAVETALVNGGVATARYLANTVTLVTSQTGQISVKIDPDVLTTDVDKVRIETPTYALTIKIADMEADLTSVMTIKAQDAGAAGTQAVSVELPGGSTVNPITVSMPSDKTASATRAVVSSDGTTASSKYNPATATLDGKVRTSGTYTVKSNEKDFTDIANKSAEMQAAIRYLATKGIINGTSATEFSPDASINRAEIVTLLIRALGRSDSSAVPTFTDVPADAWYRAPVAVSQRTGLINGYEDNTFRGTNVISKEQIVSVAGRVLRSEMNYKTPSDTASILSKYSDQVAGWAQGDVALATRENLVVYRVDGTFSGGKNMTRGDAAIIIYRLFQRIW